jgi:glycosyltransferase involved in cell wall biosynthesis
MKVVHLWDYASPRSGGLFFAADGLAQAMASIAGTEIVIVALRDEQRAYDTSGLIEIHLRLCPVCRPHAFGYSRQYGEAVADEAADLVHSHGLWTFRSIVAQRWSRQSRHPYLVSPHGMLDPWALRISRWRKRVAGWLYENATLRHAACLQALTASEARAIRSYGLTNPIAVVPNGVALPADVEHPMPGWRQALSADARVLLFLGRIHPKKGLAELIEGWSLSRREAARDGWHLVIAGWDDGGYLPALRARVEALGLGRSIVFIGARHGRDKEAAFAHADAFILPSFSEGLPMAVLEAWSYRLPVLMSEACNLPEGFSTGAALSIDPWLGSVVEGLRTLFTLSNAQRHAIGQRGRALVEERFTWPSVAHQMREVYGWVLEGGPPPSTLILH